MRASRHHVSSGARPILKKIGKPSALAVSLADMKQHLRVDGGDDDLYISGLIKAAQTYCEDYCRISITHQRWSYTIDTLEHDFIELPRRPLVQAEATVAVGDVVLYVEGQRPNPNWLSLSAGDYLVIAPKQRVTGDSHAEVLPSPLLKVSEYDANGDLVNANWQPDGMHFKSWDGNPPLISLLDYPIMEENYSVTIEFTAGFAVDDKEVPEGLKVAIKMLVGNWFLNREANASVGGPLAFGVDMILREFDSGDYR